MVELKRCRFTNEAKDRLEKIYKKAEETNSIESLENCLLSLDKLFQLQKESYVFIYVDFIGLPNDSLAWTICDKDGNGFYYGGLVYSDFNNSWGLHT